MREKNRLQHEFGDEESILNATRMAFSNEDWKDIPDGPFLWMPKPTPGVEDQDTQDAE